MPIQHRVLISVAGPALCLMMGVVAWLALTRARTSDAALPQLYFTVFGLGTFAGNMMSTSFGGISPRSRTR